MPETFRAVAVVRAGEMAGATPFEIAVLPHDERRVRRRMVPLQHGDGVLVDLPEPITLEDRDCLKLDDGRFVEIIAADEKLYEVKGRDDVHMLKVGWHLGNRHLKAQIERGEDGAFRILILRDHVIRDMLRTLGATVTEVSEPFYPEEGAYSHSHGEPVHALLNR